MIPSVHQTQRREHINLTPPVRSLPDQFQRPLIRRHSPLIRPEDREDGPVLGVQARQGSWFQGPGDPRRGVQGTGVMRLGLRIGKRVRSSICRCAILLRGLPAVIWLKSIIPVIPVSQSGKSGGLAPLFRHPFTNIS